MVTYALVGLENQVSGANSKIFWSKAPHENNRIAVIEFL